MGIFDNFNLERLKKGLAKTRKKMSDSISEIVTGRAVIDEESLEKIEEILITSDIGFDLSNKIIDRARYYNTFEKKMSIMDSIKKELSQALTTEDKNKNNGIEKFKPYVILIVGVNGAGKTTTIGKLAHNYKKANLKVIVGAADTFRAAANEQLDVWANRAGVEVVQKSKGSDPSSVAFETVQKAVKENYDIVLIDTAGRLHNKTHLMDELHKIKRVIGKVLPYAPNETLLVLDGTTGQNALIQAQEFSKVTDLNGLIITKLDGTAKGGVIFQIVAKLDIPVKYIGVGEGIDDLQTFDPELFISAIFDESN